MDLPEPKCELGYTFEQVDDIVEDYDDFKHFMRGKTGGLCGAKYTDCDEKHGQTVYKHDLERYLS